MFQRVLFVNIASAKHLWDLDLRKTRVEESLWFWGAVGTELFIYISMLFKLIVPPPLASLYVKRSAKYLGYDVPAEMYNWYVYFKYSSA